MQEISEMLFDVMLRIKISNYLVDNYDKPLKAINLSADGDEVILETK